LIAHVLGESSRNAFFDSLVIVGIAGLGLWYPVRNAHYDLRLRDGFLIVASVWILASLVTAIPFLLAAPHLSLTALAEPSAGECS